MIFFVVAVGEAPAGWQWHDRVRASELQTVSVGVVVMRWFIETARRPCWWSQGFCRITWLTCCP